MGAAKTSTSSCFLLLAPGNRLALRHEQQTVLAGSSIMHPF